MGSTPEIKSCTLLWASQDATPVFLLEYTGYTTLYSALFPFILYNQHFPIYLQIKLKGLHFYVITWMWYSLFYPIPLQVNLSIFSVFFNYTIILGGSSSFIDISLYFWLFLYDIVPKYNFYIIMLEDFWRLLEIALSSINS